MAKNKSTAVEETTLELDRDLRTGFEKVEHFVEDNYKPILSVVGVITLILLAYLAYHNWWLPSKEAEAQSQLFVAQQYFNKGDYDKVLNGDATYPGALKMINQYSGSTKAVNLAYYYAGIAYLNKGEFQKAIDNLSDFSSDDAVVNAMALGAMGDAYSELNKMSDAVNYYNKAAASSPNEFSSPMFLMKAGMAAEVNKDFKSAKSAYEQLKQKYPNSQQGRDAEKYLTRSEMQIK
ncbi:MAG: tetratricopeptide repeat protein [Chitinophagales bacterium]|jgi:tetratricopeptide (TPR) repeat protein|nr:tetratricopeptide repeat protein [Chitinophagales bacterium]